MKKNLKEINYSKIFDQLFPLKRSIMGSGYEQSLKILKEYINFKEIKYKSGKKIFDWKVPKEWVVKNAFIEFKKKKIIDIKKNFLHIINYSTKVKKKVSLKILNKHLFSLPNKPNVIPYVTSYYEKNWGFCLKHNQRKKLKNGSYKCLIDASFRNGYLINGLAELRGESKKVNLITTYLCHPNLANNELSGPLVMIGLYNRIKNWKKRNYTYNFLINPETIRSLCFLKSHGKKLSHKINSGLVLTCLGGTNSKLEFQASKYGNSSLDQVGKFLKKQKKIKYLKFDPTGGSDERQYNSPGFNMPVSRVSRNLMFPGYHNSGDTKKYMSISKIKKSIDELEKILKINDNVFLLKRTMPYGELMLGKRGLYPNINYEKTLKSSNDKKIDNREQLNILLTILNYADGTKNILDIVKLGNFNLKKSIKVLEICLEKKLIKAK